MMAVVPSIAPTGIEMPFYRLPQLLESFLQLHLLELKSGGHPFTTLLSSCLQLHLLELKYVTSRMDSLALVPSIAPTGIEITQVGGGKLFRFSLQLHLLELKSFTMMSIITTISLQLHLLELKFRRRWTDR